MLGKNKKEIDKEIFEKIRSIVKNNTKKLSRDGYDYVTNFNYNGTSYNFEGHPKGYNTGKVYLRHQYKGLLDSYKTYSPATAGYFIDAVALIVYIEVN